jgi:hypothetical protein
LTIISQVSPNDWADGQQRVYVYASQSPSDSSQFYTPEELVVDVTEIESETTIELGSVLENGKLFYKFPQGFLKSGNTYTISATAPGFESIQATTIIPEPSTISNLTIRNQIIQQSELNEYKKIVRYTVQFNIDHFGSNRYYHLVFYNEYQGVSGLWLINPEPSDNQPFINHYNYGVLIDRNNLVEGRPLIFNFLDWVVNDNSLKRVYVELRTVTADYYKYHSSLARQLIVRKDPFAEPVTIFNNIEGGYGNFSGFNQNVTSSDFFQ